MFVNGCNCSIIIKTAFREMDVPYSEETIREAVSILYEEAAIEGDGTCRAIRKPCGVTGCVVTPMTIGTAPLLLYLAFGSVGKPVFVSETRDLYQYRINLLPMEDCECFDLVQDRGTMNNEKLTVNNVRRLYERCRVKEFELRIEREQAIKLKLEITGDRPAAVYPYLDTFQKACGERFNGDCVKYTINGKEYKNIYGFTLICKKEGGTKTELWIRRVLERGNEIPEIIEELTITAQLLRDKYEYRSYGTFTITLRRLVLTVDETDIVAADAVISPLRFYVSGDVQAEVFTAGEEVIQ